MYFHPLFLFEIDGLVTMKFRVVIPKFHGKCSLGVDHRFTHVCGGTGQLRVSRGIE